MRTKVTEGPERLLQAASSCLQVAFEEYGSKPNQSTMVALNAIHKTMSEMLTGTLPSQKYHLASIDPGSGKTQALCSFLSAWKAQAFRPAHGALIVLATHKEIESCIHRSGLEAADYAIIVNKDSDMNKWGNLPRDQAPVLFTTQEMLRRLCQGNRFADVAALHFHGEPRRLRVWDEAFLPATPVTLRKDTIVQAFADLRPISPSSVATLEAIADSLNAESVGQVVRVPLAANDSYGALQRTYGTAQAERWSPLRNLAGKSAVIVNGGSRGLSLVGGAMSLPADFAPALILDASGRVRETYRAMEDSGILARLPSTPVDYRNLRIHHWDRASSRSTLTDPAARQDVLKAAAGVINASDQAEQWLIIRPLDRPGVPSLKEDLDALCDHPGRLSWLHWGDHHGTNDYRHIRNVLVIGTWRYPGPAYSALHLAAGGLHDQATDRTTLEAMRAGETRHNLLQAICRASVRQGHEGTCGDCEVYLVGRLGSSAADLLEETFPGAVVTPWRPEGQPLPKGTLRVVTAVEEALSSPGVLSVPKGTIRATLGFKSEDGLAKVLRGTAFRDWADRRGVEVTQRAFKWREAA